MITRPTRAERTRLAAGRENGYLDATGACPPGAIQAFSFWCWRLRVPLVWFDRKSPRSRHTRVRLDLFTTAVVLNDRGREELSALPGKLGIRARAAVSACDGVWDGVPRKRAAELARAVFRAATRLGNYELRNAGPSPEISRMFEAIGERLRLPKSA
jgi:hypothetical protein